MPAKTLTPRLKSIVRDGSYHRDILDPSTQMREAKKTGPKTHIEMVESVHEEQSKCKNNEAT